MRKILAAIAILLAFSATARAEEILFSSDSQVGRIGIDGNFELRDFVVLIDYTKYDGTTIQVPVKAAISLADKSTDNLSRIQEAHLSGEMVSISYYTSSISETRSCLGNDFVYDAEDSQGQPYKTCFQVTPLNVVFSR